MSTLPKHNLDRLKEEHFDVQLHNAILQNRPGDLKKLMKDAKIGSDHELQMADGTMESLRDIATRLDKKAALEALDRVDAAREMGSRSR